MTAFRSGPATHDALARVCLLGRFSLHVAGEPDRDAAVAVSQPSQRLLALLALHQRPLHRDWVSTRLWPDCDEQHASWRLRAALHRVPQPHGHRLVEAAEEHLRLGPRVEVDVRAQEAAARSLLDQAESPDLDAVDWQDVTALEHDVLPGWDDEWLLLERERHRQLRLHALESLATSLTTQRRFALALHCALAAVDAEPLRESAHRRVIEVHLAEGNAGEAIRQFRRCQRHLATELRIAPSAALRELVFGRRPDGTPTAR